MINVTSSTINQTPIALPIPMKGNENGVCVINVQYKNSNSVKRITTTGIPIKNSIIVLFNTITS